MSVAQARAAARAMSNEDAAHIIRAVDALTALIKSRARGEWTAPQPLPEPRPLLDRGTRTLLRNKDAA